MENGIGISINCTLSIKVAAYWLRGYRAIVKKFDFLATYLSGGDYMYYKLCIEIAKVLFRWLD